MKRRETLRACSLALAVLGFGPHGVAQSTFRYDYDVSQYAAPATRVSLVDQLKYVPLGAADRYLAFGAERERFEVNSNALLGYRDKTVKIYDLNRVLLFADLRYGDARVFVQLGNATEAGARKVRCRPTSIGETSPRASLMTPSPPPTPG